MSWRKGKRLQRGLSSQNKATHLKEWTVHSFKQTSDDGRQRTVNGITRANQLVNEFRGSPPAHKALERSLEKNIVTDFEEAPPPILQFLSYTKRSVLEGS